jgi:hypothetical protein
MKGILDGQVNGGESDEMGRWVDTWYYEWVDGLKGVSLCLEWTEGWLGGDF